MEPYGWTKTLALCLRGRRYVSGDGRRRAGRASLLAHHRAGDTWHGGGGASPRSHGRVGRPEGRRQRDRRGAGGVLHDERGGTTPVGNRRGLLCAGLYRQGKEGG